jgi:cold shock CspA family protein
MKGKVIKFFTEKGFGFITDTERNNRFFHISNIVNAENPKVGSMVEFKPSTNDKGLIALDIKFIDTVSVPTFLVCGNTRIKLSNIKNYGLDSETETNTSNIKKKYTQDQKRKRRKEALPNALINSFKHPLMGVASFADSMLESYYEEKVITKKEFNILYITTYQGDNYRFHEKYESFDVIKKLKELDDYFS